MRFSIVTICAFSVAACSNSEEVSDDTAEPPVAALAETTIQESDSITAVSLTTTARSTQTLMGTLDRAEDRFDVGTLAGVINGDRTEVALDGGGLITLDAQGMTYAARFDASPQGADNQTGIVGVATPDDSVPNNGQVTFSGTSVVTIQDGTTLYDLSGDATVIASFENGVVATTINSLDGVATVGLNAPTDVTDVAQITFTGSTVDGSTFTDGTLGVTSGTLSDVTADVQSSLNGAFYGPGAEETGGVFVVDDTATGDVVIFGDFIAQEP